MCPCAIARASPLRRESSPGRDGTLTPAGARNGAVHPRRLAKTFQNLSSFHIRRTRPCLLCTCNSRTDNKTLLEARCHWILGERQIAVCVWPAGEWLADMLVWWVVQTAHSLKILVP